VAVKPSAKILGRAGHRHLTATEPITGGLDRMRQSILWQTITEHAAATGLVGDADLRTEALAVGCDRDESLAWSALMDPISTARYGQPSS
jgi:hypothetical protein